MSGSPEAIRKTLAGKIKSQEAVGKWVKPRFPSAGGSHREPNLPSARTSPSYFVCSFSSSSSKCWLASSAFS
jgi:hypothetical protein